MRLYCQLLRMDFHSQKLDNLIFLDSQSVIIFKFYQVQELKAGVDVGMFAPLDH